MLIVGTSLMIFSVYILYLVSKDGLERGHGLLKQLIILISIILSSSIILYLLIIILK